MNINMNNARWFVIAISIGFSAPAQSAAPDFQDFLTRACANALPNTDFFERCNVDSVDGDLSGDSEDSLNPTQPLSAGASALAETRARIKALQSKMQSEADSSESDAAETFGISGLSFLANIETGQQDRVLTASERGFETDSLRVMVGGDFRLQNNLLAGAIFTINRSETEFLADAPGRNFEPGPSEGAIDRDAYSLNLFVTGLVGESGYADAILSYSWSTSDFSRIGVFQESTRTLPTQAVVTRSDIDGSQWSASAGIAWDLELSQYQFQPFLRATYQQNRTDPYTEAGGIGFGMQFDTKTFKESIVSAGFRFSRSFNMDWGILTPQLGAEYNLKGGDDRFSADTSFVEDPQQLNFLVTGDALDDAYGRLFGSVSFGLPNGLTVFVNIEDYFSQAFVDDSRITAGLRKEF